MSCEHPVLTATSTWGRSCRETAEASSNTRFAFGQPAPSIKAPTTWPTDQALTINDGRLVRMEAPRTKLSKVGQEHRGEAYMQLVEFQLMTARVNTSAQGQLAWNDLSDSPTP